MRGVLNRKRENYDDDVDEQQYRTRAYICVISTTKRNQAQGVNINIYYNMKKEKIWCRNLFVFSDSSVQLMLRQPISKINQQHQSFSERMAQMIFLSLSHLTLHFILSLCRGQYLNFLQLTMFISVCRHHQRRAGGSVCGRARSVGRIVAQL